MEKSIKIIALYYLVCDYYNTDLRHSVQRFSNNGFQGHITDEELITIYLFCVIEEQKTTIKAMRQHIVDYWLNWFPKIPAYQTFNARLNRLEEVFPLFINLLISEKAFDEDLLPILLGDSFPIMTCSGKRKGKVALEIADKSFCASKDKWYYGVKLHMLAQKRPSTLPYPQYLGITSASSSDLKPIEPLLENLNGFSVALDKAYCDEKLAKVMEINETIMQTPIKNVKGECEAIRQMEKAYRKCVNTAVAKVRQPIESFFNWINQKTGLQDASKVRSLKGLSLHIFGKLTACLILMM